MSNYSLIQINDLDKGVVCIQLNSPETQNTLSEKMIGELQQCLDDLHKGPSKVIILSSTGKVFSAGHDLKELKAAQSQSDQGRGYFQKILKQCSTMMRSIVNHTKPVIAQVEGVATAAGCQLALSCDLVYASSNSVFATPGVNIGLFCSTPMVALSRNASSKHAMEMLLTGDPISAMEAAQKGIITQSLEGKEVAKHVLEKANKIASKSSKTLKIGKSAYYLQNEMPLDQAYDYASQVMVKNMLEKDATEGIDAFLEKRTPHWEE